MWEAAGGQILLIATAESFLERVEFEGDEAVRIRPVGHQSPIVIDPLVRFGMATLKGIPTEAISEQVDAGDPIEVVADDFDLDVAEVVAALAYEKPLTVVAA